MQTELLLTAETLRLNPNLTCGKLCNEGFAIKCNVTQGYLTVDRHQARVLEEFTTPHTVPEVLEICIRNRTCLPLHEFYDLVLKAHEAGILSAEMAPPQPAKPAIRWFLGLPPKLMIPLAAAAYAIAAVSIVIRAPALPDSWLDVLAGCGIVAAALSLGHLIGASALRGAGCEVYRPHVRRFVKLLPHFAVDLRDSCMTDMVGRAAINASPLVPLAIALAIGNWLRQHWSFVPVLAFLIECRPFGRSLVGNILYLVRRRALLATDRAPLFDAHQTIPEVLRRRWRQFDARVATAQVLVAIVWTVVIVHGCSQYLGSDVITALEDRGTLEKVVGGTVVALAGVFLLWFGNVIQYHAVSAGAAGWHRMRVLWKRWVTHRNRMPSPSEIEALIRQNPLLRRLDLELTDELIRCLKPYRADAWKTLIRFEDDPPFVAIIVSGAVSIYRRTNTGRRSRFLRIAEGDMFGAHRLVDSDYPSLEVRTMAPLFALAVSREDFLRIVVHRFGNVAVRNYVHRHLFLQRVSKLCSDWRPASVARFAELAAKSSHAPGGRIILRGQDVMNLYVLYEGKARALRDSKPVGDINLGDVFGEISLLQSSAATADVESREGTSCLLVNRVEFIRFMARNYHVALHMERLCSQRLGRPIFPFDQASFEER